ncbi:MAG: DUF5615 family PIN-like protein [Bryobacteraceae bacterium]
MKFLIDMNLSPLWVSFLAEKGFTAVHWSAVGQPWAADSEILDYAARNDWIVFTHDLDFGTLLAALRTSRPSVIQVRTQDVLPSAIGDVVLRAIQTAKTKPRRWRSRYCGFLSSPHSGVADLKESQAGCVRWANGPVQLGAFGEVSYTYLVGK